MSSRNCIVYPCARRGGYRLPLDPEVRLKWLEAIRWPIIPLEPKKTAIVCPTHFTEGDFIEVEEGKKTLKKDAMPSVFPWNSTLWSKNEMEGNAALRSPSTTDDEEVEKADIESKQSSDSEIEIESSSSSDGENSADQADEVTAAEILPDEIMTISSDEADVPSRATDRDPEKTPITFWESSPACHDTVKRSSPGNSGACSPEKRRRLKKTRYDIIFTTSHSSSSSSDKEEPLEVRQVSMTKNEDGADSDGSDCILCEKPIESIDLTKDDESLGRPRCASPTPILFAESDSSDEGLSDEIISSPESSPRLLLDKELRFASDDSDCAIIEDNPPTIEIDSEDEGPMHHCVNPLEVGSDEEVDPLAGDPSGPVVDPLADVPSGPGGPLSDVPGGPVDPLADVPSGPVDPTSPVPPSSGNLSPVASKDPNAPLIRKNPVASKVKKTARSLYKSREKTSNKRKIEKLVSPSQIPRDYEIVGIHPTSKTLRIVLSKKKVPKLSAGESEKMEVSVDPVTACLHHDVPAPVHEKSIESSICTVIGKVRNVYSVTMKDLVSEESHLESVILQKDDWGFEPHCDALSNKLVDIIQKSQVMVGRLSQETIMSMYNLLFLSEISYGTIYWGNCEGAHQIFDLQKRFVGMMAFQDKTEIKASRATFRKNGIMTLPSIYILHCLIHVHKNLGAVKNRAALRLSLFEDKYPGMVGKVPTYEIQGLEFYLALPPHLHAPHCSTEMFIKVVKKFLRHNGLFNALEYYDMVNTFPKLIQK